MEQKLSSKGLKTMEIPNKEGMGLLCWLFQPPLYLYISQNSEKQNQRCVFMCLFLFLSSLPVSLCLSFSLSVSLSIYMYVCFEELAHRIVKVQVQNLQGILSG